MKFKELREATLTKTQIKKVHDKADDLPKNDFIKRYGKEGDSVRFATATKMVKKELGIEDYEEGFKSDAQRKAAFASGYKEKGKKKKEEVEITEASADFLRLEFEDADEVREFKKDMNRGLYRVGNRNQSARYGLYDKVTFNDNRIDGFSVELEGMEDADKFMKLMKRDGQEFTIDM